MIRNCNVHHNGQLGITAAGSIDLLIETSEIAYNNLAGFKWEWEAGGVKVTNTLNAVFRGNNVHHNTGPGLWADIDAIDTVFEENRVLHNTGPGIFHEISRGAVIRDNTVEGNGFDHSRWLWGAGILVAGSSDVEVYNNVVTGNVVESPESSNRGWRGVLGSPTPREPLCPRQHHAARWGAHRDRRGCRR